MIKKLLNKYWSGSSSVQEKKSLLDLLSKKSALENELELDSKVSISSEKSKETLRKLHLFINGENSIKKNIFSIHNFIKISAAVIILLITVIGISNYYSSTTHSENNLISDNLITVRNSDLHKSMSLKLSDKSTIILYPNSKISYLKNYNVENRTIKLSGKAKFIVAKNKALPFVVSTNQFSTTALGTVFIVDEQFSKNQSKVELLEGKVVVKALSKDHHTFNPVYLLPNQSITIDTVNYTTLVKSSYKMKTDKQQKESIEKTELVAEQEPIKNNIETKPVADSHLLVFDKTPLNEVFKKLAKRYGVEINYSNTTSKELTFTGEINGNVEIIQHLRIICQLNELKLTEQQKQFTITK